MTTRHPAEQHRPELTEMPTGQADPDQPEPVGPLAAKYLDQLAAQQAVPDLAARQRTALARLARAHQPKEKR